MAELIYHPGKSGNPESVLDSYLCEVSELLLAVVLELECYWLEGKPAVSVSVIYSVCGDAVYIAIYEDSVNLPKNMHALSVADAFDAICRDNGLTAFDLGRPLMLGQVYIEKPWGQEIWYTGIESRGVCSVSGNTNPNAASIELPWLLAAAPKRVAAELHQQLILLKILDPLPQEVLGDLYFELHQEKREVYVVTHIDSKAWPNGKGAIRMGFDQAKRASFSDDKAFRRAYLESVNRYRVIRDQVDEIIDEHKLKRQLNLSTAVTAQIYTELAMMVPAELKKAEQQAKAQMDEFTCLNELAVGDVVKVPTYTPHALQHGVRTVEFQTPVYERMILSFGQKVLTQGHWDTERAVAAMKLDVEAAQNNLELLSVTEGVVSELVVEFEDFRVLRISCQPGSCYQFVSRPSYQILMVVQGKLRFSGLQVGPEQACLVPACYSGDELKNDNAQTLVFLLAQPLLAD